MKFVLCKAVRMAGVGALRPPLLLQQKLCVAGFYSCRNDKRFQVRWLVFWFLFFFKSVRERVSTLPSFWVSGTCLDHSVVHYKTVPTGAGLAHFSASQLLPAQGSSWNGPVRSRSCRQVPFPRKIRLASSHHGSSMAGQNNACGRWIFLIFFH